MHAQLSTRRAILLGTGTAGLAAVAVLGSGIASAEGGNPPPPGPAGYGSGTAPGPAPSGAPQSRPGGAPAAGAAAGGQQQGTQSGQPAQAPGGQQAGRRPGPGIAGPGVLHGRFVRQTGTADNPTYVTEDVQRGTVTAVSATSLTVKSPDGFSETYVLTSSTKYGRDGEAGDIAVGDKVGVRATVSGDTATATHVNERTEDEARPAPSPSATS